MRYSASEKISIINEVLRDKQSVFSVCKKHNISKTTFYKWLAKYKLIKKNRLAGLESKVRKGNSHPKSLTYNQKLLILGLTHKHPEYSCRHIAKTLNIGHHAIQNLLEKEYLSRLDQRQNFANKPFWKRESADRRLGMMELHHQGWKVNDICRHFQVSKPTFIKWRKRFEQADQQQQKDALRDSYIQGSDHHMWLGDEARNQVINAVKTNPGYSVHKLHRHLAGQIGHHGIQNILSREGLNTIYKRQQYAQGYIARPVAHVPTVAVPEIAPSKFRLLFAPFATIPKFVISTPVTWPIALPFLLLFAYVFEFDKFFHPTLFFPTVALTFGLVFFIYSLKYYFSLIIVLAYSGQAGPMASEEQENRGIGKFMRGIFHSKGPKALAIHHDMDKISLEREPFVSIHLPFYNEKRVIDRLLKACTSQKWTNYEVVLADDSTDETTEIVKQLLSTEGRDLKKTFGTDDLEVYVSKKAGGPTVKLIHRSTRSGFKGAALQKALENTDPRAEFVVIFDADFVPYPDTLEQFVKTFSATCGGLEKIADSKIAVVQGYQWHVLNKSENWITRGVRSEYAGSYVVERAGAELYGGLKMIAGSVFAIRTDVLKRFGWGTSITEDLELTLKLYEAGYKVAFTPFIQAPAEAVSTVKRLIRQRMRWAEGHTFNVRKMWGRLFASKNLTSREKFEFLYMGPYYLQAFFFIAGTMAWFLSEAVLKVRLPFWTAAWGWSLVFVNFLSLPMVNLIGLFLEESDERDYLGITSFILLSYVLVPFQAYAAVKALFGKEEGPWFRTPKTGRITDVFGRANLYEWIRGLKIFQKDAVFESSTRAGYAPALNFAKISSFRPLNGYRIAGRRVRWVSRGTIAILLAAVISLNFLAFMVPESRATTTAPKLEQQINIIDSVYSTVGTTTGIVCLTPGSYNGNSATVTYTFEVVEKLSSAGTGGATLTYDAGTCASGAPSGGSTVAISTSMTTSYARYSTTFTPTGGLAYVSAISGTGAFVNAARVIITQTHASKLTTTETQVEVGDLYSVGGADGYVIISYPKHYCYDSKSTSTACAAASPTLFSPAPTVAAGGGTYFEATIYNSEAAGVTNAELYECTNSTTCTTGASVTSSAVSVTGTTATLKRSSAITLTAGKVYEVRLGETGSGVAKMANAKIILVQSDATNGISGLETIQMYQNTERGATAAYFNTGHPNSFTSGNFSGTLTYYNESTTFVSDGKSPSGTGKAQISDGASQQLGEVTSASTVKQRIRSGSISPTTAVFDSQIGCTSCSNRTFYSDNEWLIIQAQSIAVPEIAIFALPAMLFLPKIVSWWKDRRRYKREKGKNKPVRMYSANLAGAEVNWNSNISKVLGHRINGFKW